MNAHTPSQSTFNLYDYIRDLWRQQQMLYVIAGFFLGVLFAPMIRLIVADGFAFVDSLVPEAVGILFTVLILNQLAERRSIKETQEKLIREVSGRINEKAVAAVDHIREKGWQHLIKKASLSNGKLQNANLLEFDLSHVDMGNIELQKANLRKTNLEKANLQNANLTGAHLIGANLNNAYLYNANLAGASLGSCRLQGANLTSTNLDGANLSSVKLAGTDLRVANLKCANLSNAKFDENTVLPDAKFQNWQGDKPIYDKYWTPETDMTRYTDPDHPDFWQPDWVKAQNHD